VLYHLSHTSSHLHLVNYNLICFLLLLFSGYLILSSQGSFGESPIIFSLEMRKMRIWGH
jgi:hypothetical protein